MKDYSTESYLQRLSTKELETFLWQCTQLHQWDRYDHVVPQIVEMLHARNHSVPAPILASWEAHLQEKAEDTPLHGS